MNLSKMKKVISSIPDGFVITSEMFKEFFLHNQIVLTHSNIQQNLLDGQFPADMQNDILSQYSNLMDNAPSPVAVRSSSASEDLEGASFAGQYETLLNIRNEEELFTSIKKCWASFFSPIVQNYASMHNVSLEDMHMGVLVQKMVQAEVSGVVFSSNPVTHDHREVLINASYGLGETIVDGTVTPDMFIVNKDTHHITSELGLKEVQTIQTSAGSQTVEVPESWQVKFSMDEQEVLELVRVTKEIEDYYEKPVDIEFATIDKTIHILQTRPITTIKEPVT
ncbi:pyruvate-binding protein [Halobacillus litoralis]|nr:pyruvate-binding protein [Halobacillus litoralis]